MRCHYIVSIEQGKLIRVDGVPGDPTVRAEVDAVEQERVLFAHDAKRCVPTAGKPPLLPDLVEAARIAAVAEEKILAAHARPAGDPDVDRIRRGESASGDDWGRGRKKGEGHGLTWLDAGSQSRLIAAKRSNLMAEAT